MVLRFSGNGTAPGWAVIVGNAEPSDDMMQITLDITPRGDTGQVLKVVANIGIESE